MSDEKKSGTKEYVVVFDQLGVHTGDFSPGGPGHAPVAISKDYFRGDKVSLTAEDAERHLEVGAVILASDARAKHVEKNPVRTQGIKREPQVVAVQLEETPAAVAGADGAKRAATGTSLGTEAELKRRSSADLKALAAEHSIEVGPKDNKATLAKKLSKVKLAAGDGGETVNPGQAKDQSAPPESQPDEPPK